MDKLINNTEKELLSSSTTPQTHTHHQRPTSIPFSCSLTTDHNRMQGPQRRLSYDRNLYKRDMYIRSYSDQSSTSSSATINNLPTSSTTLVESQSFEDHSNGFSSPKLAPMINNNQQKRDVSPLREPKSDEGKHITEKFLFKKDW
ncbi:6854_t:CDS:1 [Ambispora gerdemannii]|uniref:6854_t:CDS:1 n=1 Tax=Ambispora gerdemannii TaxID=144530 RepID=A0A9N8W6T7_9GLOM|nr:6854_t:CDS:1 [Ambispora gerdemannii]